MAIKRTVNQGHDRLTRIALRALEFIEADPDLATAEGDRIIVILSNGSQGQQGLGLSGYVPPGGEDLALVDLGRITSAVNRSARPQLGTPKDQLPGGLHKAGGPGWLSKGKDQ